MAIGENDYATFRPRFWDDPVYFHRERFEPFSFFIYWDWDYPFLTQTAISDVYVKRIVKPWISKMVRTVNACNRTLHDDTVQLNELRRSERLFLKYSNMLKRHAVEYDDIVLALRNLKHAWEKLYDKFENPVLKYYMLKNVLMRDIEHSFFTNWASYQLNMMHRLKDKVKLFTSLHEELFKQSDHLHRCFLRQGMQAVRDKLDVLEFFNRGILSEPIKEMLRMTERSLMNDWSEVFDIQEGSPLRRMVLREVLQTSMDFLDLCLPVKRHLSIRVQVGTTSETVLTTNICKAETVVAEYVRTESANARVVCFAWSCHRLYYKKAKAMTVVLVVMCLLCIPTCRGANVDSKADLLSQLFSSDEIKDLYIEDVRYLVFRLHEPSLEDFHKQWTGICYNTCRNEHQGLVYGFEENKTHTFEEDCGISSWLDGEIDIWICTNKCGTICSSAQCHLQDGIKDVYIEDFCQLVIILEEPSLEDFYKQLTEICYYIFRHKHRNLIDAHKCVFVFVKENQTHTFEDNCDFGIYYFLHIEQESSISSWLDGKIDDWICTNKCGTVLVCSPAQCLLQGFEQVVDKLLQECSQNQPNSLLEMTNRTVKVICLKPNKDKKTMDTEEKMKMQKSSHVFNTILLVWLAIIALSRMKLIVFCAWISIKHVKLKSPNPITWIFCKKHSATTPDLAWFRGNSKLPEYRQYKSIEVQKEVACQRKPVQEQTKTPESKPTEFIDRACSETPEMYYSLTEKYSAPLLSMDESFEESNELLNTTQSIETDPNTEFVYDEQCETDIRKCTEINRLGNKEHTKNQPIRNFQNTIKELEKRKNIPNVVAGCNSLLSARIYGDETFYDLKWKRKLQLKVHPELQSEKSFHLPDNTVIKEEAYRPTAKFENDVDFDKLSAEKENPGRRRKRVDSTFSEKEIDQIHLLRYLTWLPLNQLPVPKVELIVGFVPDFPPLMAIIDLIAIGKPPAPHVSMRYELLRFCTLRSYPREDKPFLIKLAEAGFYYASDGDGVVCYCCGIRRYNWTADDYPMKIHKRINPTCKFLTKNDEVNVRNDFNGPFSKSLLYIDSIPEPGESQEPSEDINNDWAPERTRSPAPRPQSSQNSQSSSQLGINTAIPKHSQYATKPARIASFNGWPDSASHSPDELADAGFFYAGFGDCVRCFYCGIGLRHWTQDDNPWIEHARWAKNCVFVKQKKGDEFVNLVQLAVQYSQDNASQENTAANQLSPREIENYLLSDASQSVLAMGYQPRIIKKAIENILRQNRQTEITAQFLMEQVLALEEAGNSTQAAPASGSPAAPVAHVDPTEGALASAPKQSASIKSNDKESGNATHKPVANEKKKEEKKTSKKTNAEAKETRSNDALAQDPKAIKAENEQLKEQTLCKICLDQTVSIVFLPCGHLVTCADCAPAMRKCPICRALVQGTVRTYMS